MPHTIYTKDGSRDILHGYNISSAMGSCAGFPYYKVRHLKKKFSNYVNFEARLNRLEFLE